MKNTTFKTIGDFQRLKESLNDVIDKRITKMKLEECINSFNSLSFACLNEIFKNTVDKLYETKEGKRLIKKYVKTIKESNDLKKVYSIYNIVNSPNKINDGTLFIKESISLIKEIDKKNYGDSLSSISDIVKECAVSANLDTEAIENIKDKYHCSINESLDYVLFNKMDINNVVEYTNGLSRITNFINENKKHENDLMVEEKSICELIGDFDKLFTNDIEIWESTAIKDISLAELSGKGKKGVFEEYKSECLSIIEENLNEKDAENSSRFQGMKEKLLKKEFNSDTIVEDILMLSELKHVLKS